MTPFHCALFCCRMPCAAPASSVPVTDSAHRISLGSPRAVLPLSHFQRWGGRPRRGPAGRGRAAWTQAGDEPGQLKQEERSWTLQGCALVLNSDA
eukprot:1394513-Rhodomonas_salina.2